MTTDLHDLHRDALGLIDDFVTEHGRHPSREADDPAERNLAEWHQRAMTDVWRFGNSEWKRPFELVGELKSFEELHQRMRVPGAADEAEAWLARRAKSHLRKSYPHPLMIRLAAKHDWYRRPGERRAEELKAFIKQPGRLPGPQCKTEHEESLWRWVRNRLDRGTRPAEAQRVVDAAGGYRAHLLQRKAQLSQRAR
jgi:hypothetical protein